MSESISVEVRGLGLGKPLLDDFSIDPPQTSGEGEGPMTLRRLITLIVLERAQADSQSKPRPKFPSAMDREQIQRGSVQGKVAPAPWAVRQGPPPDQEEAVQAALQAFEDRLYLVVIDEKPREDLDELVVLRSGSRIAFLMLSMLSGG
jgi:hypothetical protein